MRQGGGHVYADHQPQQVGQYFMGFFTAVFQPRHFRAAAKDGPAEESDGIAFPERRGEA